MLVFSSYAYSEVIINLLSLLLHLSTWKACCWGCNHVPDLLSGISYNDCLSVTARSILTSSMVGLSCLDTIGMCVTHLVTVLISEVEPVIRGRICSFFRLKESMYKPLLTCDLWHWQVNLVMALGQIGFADSLIWAKSSTCGLCRLMSQAFASQIGISTVLQLSFGHWANSKEAFWLC